MDRKLANNVLRVIGVLYVATTTSILVTPINPLVCCITAQVLGVAGVVIWCTRKE